MLPAGSAVAATPQQVYRDLADNGRLDRQYSRADIERAFGNLPAYARPEAADRQPQGVRQPGRTLPVTADDGGVVPFSGLDAALFGAVGGPLLLIAAAMRHVARTRPRHS
jgi:hypothetical protein